MKTLIIQQGSGNAYREMLRVTTAHHREYADRHDMDLWTISGPVQTGRRPVWDKVPLIQQALALQHYELVVWLDADTLIHDRNADLRDAASEFDHIGMTRHNGDWGACRNLGWHYNAGAIFIRPSLATIQAFDKVWTAGENPDVEEQGALMELWAECPGLFQTLSYRWNAFAVAPSEDAVILAWHGYNGDRAAEMSKAMNGK